MTERAHLQLEALNRSLTHRDAPFSLPARGRHGPTPIEIAVRRKWQILSVALVLTGCIWLVLRQLPVRYSATASLMVDPRQPRLSSGESLLSSQVVDPELLSSYMASMRSPSLSREVVQELGLDRDRRFCPHPRRQVGVCSQSVDEATAQLEKSMTFSNDGRSYIITATADAADAVLAARVANAYANAFIGRRRDQQIGLTDKANLWLSTHLAQLRQTVVAADDAVERQRRTERLTNLQGQTLLAQSLSETNAQLNEATAELTQKQSILREIEGPGGRADANDAVLASPIIHQLIDQESALASAHADLGTRLGSRSPEVIANDAQLAQIRREIRQQTGRAVAGVRGEVEALAARRAALAASVKDLQDRVGQQGVSGMRLQDLEGEAASAQSRYNEAAVRLEQIRLDAALQRSDVQLVVEASPPVAPSFPRMRMMLVGSFLAMLGVGTGLACVFELLARTFTSADRLEDQAGAPVLGLFARMPARRGQPATTVLNDPASREAENLHAMLTGLIGGSLGHRAASDRRVLLVTSAVAGEGKTSLCVAMALAAMTRGLSAVVLDGDLRRSGLKTMFPRLEASPRTSSGRALTTVASPAFDRMIDRQSGLHVLASLDRATDQNPYATLAGADLPSELQRLRAEYDLVIIDTPPVLAVTDAVSLASLADDVVLVVEWRATARSAVLSAIKTLRSAHVDVAGMVLSKVDLRRYARLNSGGSDQALRAYQGAPRAGQAA